MMAPRDWDADSYDVVSTPQQTWGAAVVGRVDLRGSEDVLDAGCGTGLVTQMLLDRLPVGRVVAVDGSPSMVAAARARLDPARVEVICCDLLDLSLDRELDAAISTATFHWIADHDRLFARIRAGLRTGAAFVAQCGGHGNIDRVRRIAREVTAEPAYAVSFVDWPGPWHYATPHDTQVRLEAAGFEVDRCWLEPAPVRPPRPREFLATVILGPYLDRLPPAVGERFVDDVVDRLGPDPILDYVRLNWDARAC